ncbi:MAG: YcxB family protein [Lachnospiraceae bacterium]
MTILYKVVTGHTREVLEDFVNFTYRVKYPKGRFRLCVLGAGLLILSLYATKIPAFMYIFAVLGVTILGFALVRPFLAVRRLSRNDELYLKQSGIEFVFGQSGLEVYNELEKKKSIVKYGEITAVYKDKRNYLLSINNEQLHFVPYRDFCIGDAVHFQKFIEDKTNKTVIDLCMPLIERMRKLNADRKRAEALHDQKIADKKNMKKK